MLWAASVSATTNTSLKPASMTNGLMVVKLQTIPKAPCGGAIDKEDLCFLDIVHVNIAFGMGQKVIAMHPSSSLIVSDSSSVSPSSAVVASNRAIVRMPSVKGFFPLKRLISSALPWVIQSS